MALNHYTRLQGQSGLERRLDAIREDLHKLRICESSTVKVEQTTRGQVLTVVKKGGGGEQSGQVLECEIAGVDGDYLTCGSDIGSIVVAKPYWLRRSTWSGRQSGGINYSIDAQGYALESITDAGVRFTEYLEPNYAIGETIFAAYSIGGTGATSSGGNPIDYIDLNVDARIFQFPKREVAVCINNDSTWRMRIRGSDPYRP